MRIFARLKSWLRPDPADALKGAENEVLLAAEDLQRAEAVVRASQLSAAIPLISSLVLTEYGRDLARRQAAAYLPTPYDPNNQPIALPPGSEDATSVSNDLHDV